jgi:glycosyltransferase involved in cell wall biosynthesis
VKVIPPVIQITQAEEPHVRQRQFVLASRLVRNKGVFEIIDAWHRVEHRGFKLVIAGAGPLGQYVRKASDTEVDLIYLGPLEHKEVLRLFRQSMWGLVGGTVRESFGLSAAELLASGTPLVFRRTGALPELAEGLGFGFHASGTLERQIEKAINLDTSEWNELSMRAEEKGKSMGLEAFEQSWVKFLNDL